MNVAVDSSSLNINVYTILRKHNKNKIIKVNLTGAGALSSPSPASSLSSLSSIGFFSSTKSAMLLYNICVSYYWLGQWFKKLLLLLIQLRIFFSRISIKQYYSSNGSFPLPNYESEKYIFCAPQ